MTDRALVVGAGAIGCFFAARLQRLGIDTTLVTRRSAVEAAIRTRGVEVLDERPSGNGTDFVVPLDARAPDDLHAGYDVAIVAVKSDEVSWAVDLARAVVHRDGAIISTQNGLVAANIVETHDNGVAGTTYQGVDARGPGIVAWTVEGDSLVAPRRPLDDVIASFVDAVDAEDFHWRRVDDRDAMLWTKLIVAISNSLSGALAIPVHELLASKTSGRILQEARTEACAVARALRIRIDSDALLRSLADPGPLAVGTTPGSTFQSLRSGRRPEIADISGTISRAGRTVAVPTPVNDLLLDLTEARWEVMQRGGDVSDI